MHFFSCPTLYLVYKGQKEANKKVNKYPSYGSKTTIRGGHSPRFIMFLHKAKVSTPSFDRTCMKLNTKSTFRLVLNLNEGFQEDQESMFC